MLPLDYFYNKLDLKSTFYVKFLILGVFRRTY